MAKTEQCPECKAMLDPRGIQQHRSTAHGVASKKPTARREESEDEAPPPDADSTRSPAAPAKTRDFWNCLDPDW